jgi:hypothetical protein
VSVVVADERVLLIDGLSHEVSHRYCPVEEGIIDKSVGLLRLSIAVTVVAREGLESTDLMPSCAEMRRAVFSREATNVTSNEGNTEHIHHHAASD